MKRSNNNQHPEPEDHSVNQPQRTFYNYDWNNVSKEEACGFTPSEPYYPCYQQIYPNFPIITPSYTFSNPNLGLPINRFSLYPMPYPFQMFVQDPMKDYHKSMVNTEAPNDDEAKKDAKSTKAQIDSEDQNAKMTHSQKQHVPKRNQIQPLRQPFPHSSITHKHLIDALGSGEMTREDRVNRYRIKKAKRNYEKRIVYECRKSVADNRQRSKGRFVKRVQTGGEQAGDETQVKKAQIIMQ